VAFRLTNPNLLRQRKSDHGRVTFVELFFDLVFVFAVTQLSHLLLARLTPLGLLQTVLLLMAVWWVWIYTSWVTNWLDPERMPVRLLLFVLMLAGLLLSSALPHAFENTGLVFAVAFVGMQVGRSLFMLWALRGHAPRNFRNFQRITIWLVVSGAFWIAGGFAGEARLWLWLVALAIEYVSPAAGFYVPGLGRSVTADWDISGEHLAERCAAFIIIALGESIVIIGVAFSEGPWQFVSVTSLVLAFIGSAAMWWIYFNIGAEWGKHRISASDDPGSLARTAFTYFHLPLVAGIIVAAVADELVLAHPFGPLRPAVIACILGGPALYLAGNLIFKRLISGFWALSHMVGFALLAITLALSAQMTPIVLYGAAAAILVVVAVWETRSLGGKPAPVKPAPVKPERSGARKAHGKA
jgi:low temperature requirement protein LtrA